MKKASYAVALCVVMVLILSQMRVSKAVTCVATQLAPCLPALTSSQPPSAACCSKLKEQQPCLCGYLKDPNLSQYVNSPNAKRVASTCGVAIPKC